MFLSSSIWWKNPADRQVAEFLSAAIALGRTIFAPPDVPAERIAALRRAFDATMTDPAYLEECKTRNLSTGGPNDWRADGGPHAKNVPG